MTQDFLAKKLFSKKEVVLIFWNHPLVLLEEVCVLTVNCNASSQSAAAAVVAIIRGENYAAMPF